jgi:hypothetical protein
MIEKSFLEILSEKIEKQILQDISQGKTPSNKQTREQSPPSSQMKNVDNPPEDRGEKDQTNQWMSQIPMGKIHFSTPKHQVFGRVYPLNTPKAKPQPPRKKHVLTEIQQQAVVYFWGWQIKLQEDFTAQELKKAFRSLAHRLHPDRNDGKTKAFIEMKARYNCLLSVFNKS